MSTVSHSPIMIGFCGISIIQPVQLYFHLGDLKHTAASTFAATGDFSFSFLITRETHIKTFPRIILTGVECIAAPERKKGGEGKRIKRPEVTHARPSRERLGK